MYRNINVLKEVYKVYTKALIKIVKSVKIDKITNPWSGKELNVKTLNTKHNNKLIDDIINNYFKV